MRTLPPPALPGLALATALVLTACTSSPEEEEPTGPRAQVGDVVPHALSSDVEGQHAYVVVPGYRYDVLVSSPQEEMDAASAGDAGVATVPADGAAVVEVTWKATPSDGDWFAAVADDDPQMPLALVVGGETYDVGELDEDGLHAAYVVVPEDTDEVSVEVGYEGLTQVVEVVGADPIDQPIEAPARLYGTAPRLEPLVEQPGGLRRRDDLVGGEVSTRALTPVPYVTGLGWAPAGRSWVLVDVSVTGVEGGIEVGEEYVAYDGDGGEVEVRLDRRRPQELLPYGSPRPDDEVVGEDDPLAGDDTWRAQAVFLVRDDTTGGVLKVERPYSLRPEDPDQAEALGTPRDLDQTLTLRRELVL